MTISCEAVIHNHLPKNRGPIAYARTKTDNTSCDSTSFVMPNSFDIDVRAGATMDDETGEMRVKKDTTIVAAHFRLKVQFLGFAGSSEPSHETCTASQ